MALRSVNHKWIGVFSVYNVIKIVIISMVGFYLLGNFVPYYEGADAFLYGITTIDLFEGSYGFTNHLLQEDASWDFVPYQYSKTIHNTAIPIGDVGIYGFTSIFYFLGGYYGLFYVGPILTILFLIIAERIATNLFGRAVGLITLILLASDFIILWIGQQLRNDTIFLIFFILGIFYLIKFFHNKTDKSILLCSIFFAIGALIRINGIIAFPLEIFLIVGYFAFHALRQIKKEARKTQMTLFIKNIFSKMRKKEFVKKTFLLLIPWIILLLFMISFNQYYFGNPLTTYFDERPETLDYKIDSKLSIFKFDSWRFTWINFYSLGFLPDLFNNLMFNSVFTNFVDNLGGNPLGVVPFLILFLTLIISLYYKVKRIEVIVFITFIFGIILFYSAGFLHAQTLNEEDFQPTLFSRDRYMMPALPLYLMIFGFAIYLIWKLFIKRISNNGEKISAKCFKSGFVIIIGIFLVASIFYSQPVQGALDIGIKFKNPEWFTHRFPLDSEGLSEQNSIILHGKRYSVEYDAISFFPYWGYWGKQKLEFDAGALPQEPIKKLKQLMMEDYNVYVFKNRHGLTDSEYFRYLEDEHGLILKKYSETFCKIEQINNLNLAKGENSESDEDCYFHSEYTTFVITEPVVTDEGEYVPKRFTLVPPLKSFLIDD